MNQDCVLRCELPPTLSKQKNLYPGMEQRQGENRPVWAACLQTAIALRAGTKRSSITIQQHTNAFYIQSPRLQTALQLNPHVRFRWLLARWFAVSHHGER